MKQRTRVVFDFARQQLFRAPEVAPQTPLQPQELFLEDALRVERNVVLTAGAGTGKTHSMIGMALHALTGARKNLAPLLPDQLVLLTFTEKAAAEMRHRLYERVSQLAHGHRQELELARSFELLGLAFPNDEFFQKLHLALGAVKVETIHAYALSLLQRHHGVRRAILSERSASELARQCLENSILSALENQDAQVEQMVVDFGFGAEDRIGILTSLVPVFQRLNEEGLAANTLNVGDPVRTRQACEVALSELRWATQRALAAVSTERARLLEFQDLVKGLNFDTVRECLPQLASLISRSKRRELEPLQALVCEPESARAAPGFLGALWAAAELAPFEEAVRRLLQDAQRSYFKALANRDEIDFAAVLSGARDALAFDVEFRRSIQSEVKLLLVDEFQDTNRLQFEIVLLLAEERAQGPRKIVPSDASVFEAIQRLPLEPAALALVGDRKQAIYEFRGAEVEVFALAQQKILNGGGQLSNLNSSRRSSPQLVSALNALSAQVLGRDRYARKSLLPFEVVFEASRDNLRPVRNDIQVKPLVQLEDDPNFTEQKSSSAKRRQRDAQAVAAYLSECLHAQDKWVEPKNGAPRKLRGGDVAILFQRFTHVETYRQALVRAGLRHRVIKGRGFFGAQEVLDMASLLALVADPHQVRSRAAVFRSPFVAVSDAALLQVLKIPALTVAASLPLLDELEADERRRLLFFLAAFEELNTLKSQLPLAQFIERALELTQFRVRVAAAPFGEQALANLSKLVSLARSEEAAHHSFTSFARELSHLAQREPRAEQGEMVSGSDEDAIVLCTVHQAKGLEWPWVVLPDLDATANSGFDLLRFDRSQGLALRHPHDECRFESPRASSMAERSSRQRSAERWRLLYVALTRARDRVVLGLRSPKPRIGTWSSVLGMEVLPPESWEAVSPTANANRAPSQLVDSPPADRSTASELLARVRARLPQRSWYEMDLEQFLAVTQNGSTFESEMSQPADSSFEWTTNLTTLNAAVRQPDFRFWLKLEGLTSQVVIRGVIECWRFPAGRLGALEISAQQTVPVLRWASEIRGSASRTLTVISELARRAIEGRVEQFARAPLALAHGEFLSVLSLPGRPISDPDLVEFSLRVADVPFCIAGPENEIA
jgi:ATP-dependent helicase/nuclease subunit A